jgi:hypothetical protein
MFLITANISTPSGLVFRHSGTRVQRAYPRSATGKWRLRIKGWKSSQLSHSLNLILSIDGILAIRQYDNTVCINCSGCNQDA